jgi:hypothetical protein
VPVPVPARAQTPPSVPPQAQQQQPTRHDQKRQKKKPKQPTPRTTAPVLRSTPPAPPSLPGPKPPTPSKQPVHAAAGAPAREPTFNDVEEDFFSRDQEHMASSAADNFDDLDSGPKPRTPAKRRWFLFGNRETPPDAKKR